MINRTNKAFTSGSVNISFNMSMKVFEEIEDRKISKSEEFQRTMSKINFVGLGMESCSIIGKIKLGPDNKDGWYVTGTEPNDRNRSEILWSSKIINDRAFDLEGLYDIASKPRVDKNNNSCRKSCVFVVFLEDDEEEFISQTINSLYDIIEIGDIIMDKNNEIMIFKNDERMELPFSVVRLLVNDLHEDLPLPNSNLNAPVTEVKPIIIASR